MDGRSRQDPQGRQAPSSVGAGGSVPAPSSRRPAPPVASEDLFAGATEVQISHRGSLYRLKQTALGKLILTK